MSEETTTTKKYEGYEDLSGDGGVLKLITTPGSGPVPTQDAEVQVHYTGTLEENGKQFDSSRGRGLFKFRVGPRAGVIEGWKIAVATMKIGEVCQVVLAPKYAYGERGAGADIPPNATLRFEIELVDWTLYRNVSEDGTLSKMIMVESQEHARPNEGATVRAIVRGFVLNQELKREEQFHKATKLAEGADPVKLEVDSESKQTGEGNDDLTTFAAEEWVIGEKFEYPDGLHEAVKTMYIGERSKFRIKPDLMYGAQGNKELGVPGGATVEYEITLVGFKRHPESFEMLDEAKLARMEKLKELGNTLFGSKEYDRALRRYTDGLKFYQYEGDMKEDLLARVHALKISMHTNSALCYRQKGDTEEALKSLDEALEVDDSNAKALMLRGHIWCIDRKDPKKALPDLEKANAKAPNAATTRALKLCQQRLNALKKRERDMFKNVFSKVRLVTPEEEQKRALGKTVSQFQDDFSDESSESDSDSDAMPGLTQDADMQAEGGDAAQNEGEGADAEA